MNGANMRACRLNELQSENLGLLLSHFSNEELNPLYQLLVDPISEGLSLVDRVKRHYPNHRAYVDLIERELRLYGGNSLVNSFRGEGPSYREIVHDVCCGLKVNVEATSSVRGMEQALLQYVFDSLPEKERNSLSQAAAAAGYEASTLPAPLSVLALGYGARFIGTQLLGRVATVVTGPVGWIVSGLWAVGSLTSPASRVITPAVIHIAFVRKARIWKAELEAE